MKLYTEEQMAKVWKAGQKYWETSGASITFEDLLEHEKPIEIPSDEEIVEVVEQEYKRHDNNEFLYGRSDETKLAYKAGVWDGLKWMKEEILNQNK